MDDFERLTLADFPPDQSSHPLPKDSDDHYVHVGPLLPGTRKRVDRLIRSFLTLCNEEQELVVQELEIG